MTIPRETHKVTNKILWLILLTIGIITGFSIFGFLWLTGAWADSSGGFDSQAQATMPNSETISVVGTETSSSPINVSVTMTIGNGFSGAFSTLMSLTFSIGNSTSVSSSGSQYNAPPLTFSVVGTSVPISPSISPPTLTFSVVGATSGTNVSMGYPTVSLTGVVASVPISSLIGLSSLTFHVVGTDLENGLGILFSSTSMSAIATQLPSLPSSFGGFDAVAQEIASSSVSIPSIGAMGEGVIGVSALPLTLSVVGVTKQSWFKDVSIALTVVSASSSVSNASFSDSLAFIVGDFYRWGQPDPSNLTFSVIGANLLSSQANQNPPQQYNFSTLAGISSVGNYGQGNLPISYSTVLLMAAGVQQVSYPSTTLSGIAAMTGNGYIKISLPVTFMVSSGEGGGSGYAPPGSNAYIVGATFIDNPSWLSSGSPIASIPINSLFLGNSQLYAPIRYVESAYVSLTPLGGLILAPAYLTTTAIVGIQSTAIGVAYLTVPLQVVGAYSPVSQVNFNSSISFSMKAYMGEFIGKLKDVLFKMIIKGNWR